MFELIPYARRNHGVASYNPFKELEELEKNFFGGALSDFKTDIKDVGNAYMLEADLPGFKKEDISIDIDSDYMKIKAERHSEFEDKDKKGNYIRCERSYGAYERSFDISGINADGISAEYSDGVLKLTMPKKENAAPASRRLEIK